MSRQRALALRNFDIRGVGGQTRERRLLISIVGASHSGCVAAQQALIWRCGCHRQEMDRPREQQKGDCGTSCRYLSRHRVGSAEKYCRSDLDRALAVFSEKGVLHAATTPWLIAPFRCEITCVVRRCRRFLSADDKLPAISHLNFDVRRAFERLKNANDKFTKAFVQPHLYARYRSCQRRCRRRANGG